MQRARKPHLATQGGNPDLDPRFGGGFFAQQSAGRWPGLGAHIQGQQWRAGPLGQVEARPYGGGSASLHGASSSAACRRQRASESKTPPPRKASGTPATTIQKDIRLPFYGSESTPFVSQSLTTHPFPAMGGIYQEIVAAFNSKESLKLSGGLGRHAIYARPNRVTIRAKPLAKRVIGKQSADHSAG